MSETESIRMIRGDGSRESYKPFHDDDWTNDCFDLVPQSLNEDLYCYVNDLVVECKWASDIFSMPWLSVEMCAHFDEGYRKGRTGLATAVAKDFSGRLATRVNERLNKSDRLNWRQRKVLDSVAGEVAANAEDRRVRDVSNRKFDRDGFWHFLVNNEESKRWAQVLASVPKQAYCNLFFAYEDFITSCGKWACSNTTPSTRWSGNPSMIANSIENGLGNAELLWTGPEITIARLARNSLVHCGGRENRELADLDHPLFVNEGRICISPDDVRTLYKQLTRRATSAIQSAILLLNGGE